MGTINELNTTDTLAGDDKLVIWKDQAGATRAITAEDAAAYFSIAGGPYQPLDELLTAIAAQGPNTANGDFIQLTGQDTVRVRKLTVATYAALTVIPASFRFDDMLVYVASRATDGDGGEGWWRFDAASSATANGGTILAPDAGTGRWIRQLEGPPLSSQFAQTGAGLSTALGLGAYTYINGNVANTTTALTVDYGDVIEFAPGFDIASSGSGSLTNNGIAIRTNYNPDGLSSWTTSSATKRNYEAFSVEIGNFGARDFDGFCTPAAITGVLNIPSDATVTAHAMGVAAYVDTASTTTAAVGVYSEVQPRGNGVSIFAMNSRTIIPAGRTSVTAYGYEIDVNNLQSGTNCDALFIAGGSTAAFGTGNGIRVASPNIFDLSPSAVKWTRSFFSDDGASTVGLELGSAADEHSAPQTIRTFYRNSGDARTLAFTIGGDNGGNVFLRAEESGTLFDIQSDNGSGGFWPGIRIYGNNTGIGFSGLPGYSLHVGGAICFAPGASVAPTSNGEVVIEATNNTTLTFKLKGSDGVVRSAALTLT